VYHQLRKELSNKSIGDVKALSVHFGFKADTELKQRLSDLKLGGGAALDIGCYAVQLANLVFNNEKPEKIVVNGSLYPTGNSNVLTIVTVSIIAMY